MSPVNVKCSSNTKILVSLAAMIAFVGADAIKGWTMIVTASSWVVGSFRNRIYVNWKSIIEEYLGQNQSFFVGILPLRLQPAHSKST